MSRIIDYAKDINECFDEAYSPEELVYTIKVRDRIRTTDFEMNNYMEEDNYEED